MTKTLASANMESLVCALETMAFTTPTLARPALAPAPNSFLISMPFTGPVCGTVEMVAAERVGIRLAANVLAIGPEDPVAKGHAKDALKELLNVTCGLLLPKLTPVEAGGVPVEMTLPRLEAFDSQRQWPEMAAACDTCVLEVDGALIALRVKCA